MTLWFPKLEVSRRFSRDHLGKATVEGATKHQKMAGYEQQLTNSNTINPALVLGTCLMVVYIILRPSESLSRNADHTANLHIFEHT